MFSSYLLTVSEFTDTSCFITVYADVYWFYNAMSLAKAWSWVWCVPDFALSSIICMIYGCTMSCCVWVFRCSYRSEKRAGLVVLCLLVAGSCLSGPLWACVLWISGWSLFVFWTCLSWSSCWVCSTIWACCSACWTSCSCWASCSCMPRKICWANCNFTACKTCCEFMASLGWACKICWPDSYLAVAAL